MIVVIILIMLASVFNAIMDLIAHDKTKYNPDEMWKNKWKNGDPAQGEKFLFSSTILVWTTDFWHLAQFLFHSTWQLALALSLDVPEGLQYNLIAFIVIKVVFSGMFELIYRIKK